MHSVRDKPPLRVVCMSSHSVGAFYFSQIYTDEQNTQRPTETSSQPISQNLTAIFGSNVLWILYAGGVLWVRNCAQKGSVRSVSSVREKTPQRVSKMFFFSQRTQMNRTHKAPQRHQVNRFHRTLQPSLAITFCEFCMPEAFCGLETVRKKVLLDLWVLWEKNLPSELHASHLVTRVRFISHRFTQMNRTHSISQRH